MNMKSSLFFFPQIFRPGPKQTSHILKPGPKQTINFEVFLTLKCENTFHANYIRIHQQESLIFLYLQHILPVKDNYRSESQPINSYQHIYLKHHRSPPCCLSSYCVKLYDISAITCIALTICIIHTIMFQFIQHKHFLFYHANYLWIHQQELLIYLWYLWHILPVKDNYRSN